MIFVKNRTEEQNEILDLLTATVPFKGKADLKNPSHVFWIILVHEQVKNASGQLEPSLKRIMFAEQIVANTSIPIFFLSFFRVHGIA
jgi:hypothetical protein